MIIWAEGFDHYGTSPNSGRDAMLAGAWAEFSAGNGTLPAISNDRARTGTYSLKVAYNALANDSPKARRVLTASHIVVGCAAGWYFDALPAANKGWGFEFRNNANECIVFVCVQSDGAIGIYAGSSRTLILSSDPVMTSAAWHHIEAKIICDELVGEVEVRVNGNAVLHGTGLNLGSLGSTQICFGMPSGETGNNNTVYIDDIVTWNDSGDDNTDFIGQQRVETIWPVSDTAQADWGLQGDTDGFGCIDNIPPDGDTTYLTGETDDVSEFGLGDLPPETVEIRGVYVPAMAKIIAAGVGNLQTSLVSGAAVSVGPEHSLTTSYAYHGSVHERDPDTDAAWTRSGVEAALLRLEKTL